MRPPAKVAQPLRNAFGKGGEAVLLGVATAADPKTWWSPDGSPVAGPLAPATLPVLKDPYGEMRATYEFAIRLTDLPRDPEAVHLSVSGHPRPLFSVPMSRSAADPSLYFGAALLYPEQRFTNHMWIRFSTKPWREFRIDATGHVQSPELTPPGIRVIGGTMGRVEGDDAFYGSLLRVGTTNQNIIEQNGRTWWRLGAEPWADCEYRCVAVGKDGVKHEAIAGFFGPVGDEEPVWSFDVLPGEIDHFDLAIRTLDQVVAFHMISLKSGLTTVPSETDTLNGVGVVFDSAFYGQRFGEVRRRVMSKDLAGAEAMCAQVLEEAKARRSQMETENSPYAYIVDKGMPLLEKLLDALHRGDQREIDACMIVPRAWVSDFRRPCGG